MRRSRICVMSFLLVFFIVLQGSSIGAYSIKNTSQNIESSNITALKPKLPVVGSYENLKKLIENHFKNLYRGFPNGDIAYGDSVINGGVKKSAGNLEVTFTSDQQTQDYSTTNIQVQGVDESDIVKTDGKYIYQVSNRRIIITKAYPGNSMSIESKINFDDKNFYPSEMYLDAKRLVVIGRSQRNVPGALYDGYNKSSALYCPPIRFSGVAKVLVYDISDKGTPKLLKELEIDGNIIASRRIGSKVYITANKYLNPYVIKNSENDIVPSYRDTAKGNGYVKLDYSKIKYFPECLYPNYLITASFDINDTKKEATISAYLGAGEMIYVSNDNMYVTMQKYNEQPVRGLLSPDKKTSFVPFTTSNTFIYRFELNNGEIIYNAKGDVPGQLLNQFSMDEHNRYFRVATTSDEYNEKGRFISKNNVYVLDMDMNIKGRIENIAPGERIYSTRFIGDRGYMVTFKTVDPLFVIDLKNPENPSILGALKIPGYSDYLHPYDENHIIGFGKDTIEAANKIEGSKESFPIAYYLGMKVALFDVRDVNNPIEKFSVKIGDRGTDSELLRDHKALLFSREKNLLVFPITVMECKNKSVSIPPEYGTFAFQGAYIYSLDKDNGFKLKGTITHLEDEDYDKSGMYWYDNAKSVQRIIYIGDTLYTISQERIKANNIYNMKEIGSIKID